MKRWLRPRWWLWHLLVVAVALTFVQLGLWQLSRHDQRAARNELLEARLGEAPRAYPEAAAQFDPDAPEGAPSDPRFRPVTVTGRFAPEHEVLLRGRGLEGRPGYHVLTPLVLDGRESRAVLVDRGWVPYEMDEPNDAAFAPPPGRVTVEGRLMPEADPPTGPLAALAPRDPPEGPLARVARADVERLAPQMPLELEPFVVEASAAPGNGDGAAELPRVPPPPQPEAGPHLAYAAQWFFFALVAVVGYGLLLRQRARDAGPDAD